MLSGFNHYDAICSLLANPRPYTLACEDCLEGFLFFRTLTFSKTNSWLVVLNPTSLDCSSLRNTTGARRHSAACLSTRKAEQADLCEFEVTLPGVLCETD